MYLLLSGGLGFPLLALWLGVAIFLGNTFNRAIENKESDLLILSSETECRFCYGFVV